MHSKTNIPILQCAPPQPASDRPSMLGGIDSVSFGIFDPAFGHRAEDIGFGGSLRGFFDRLDALDLKTEVMDSPGERRRVNQGEIQKAVGKIDGAVFSPMLFLHAKNLLVVLRAFFAVPHV